MATDTASLRLKVDSRQAKTAKNELDRLAKSGGKAEKATDGLTSSFKRNAAIAIGVAAAWKLGSVSLQAFIVQEKAVNSVNAVIEATGHAAGFTTEELEKMASAMQEVTTFGDEMILQGQSILLTFRNIRGEAFERTSRAMLDMAQIMGTDLKSTAIQLGKALNDPITGMTALTRSGITFTDEQKKTIKTMQLSGDLLGAQTVILAELEAQFGGAATAAADTFGGEMRMLGNDLGDVTEIIGKGLVPWVRVLAKEIKAAIPAMKEFAERSSGLADFFGIDLRTDVEKLTGRINELKNKQKELTAAIDFGNPKSAKNAEISRELIKTNIDLAIAMEKRTQAEEKNNRIKDKSVDSIRKNLGVIKEIEDITKIVDPSAFVAVWMGTIDTFSRGIGDAFATAIIDGENLIESWSKLQDAIRRQAISSVIEIGTKKAIFAIAEKAAMLDIFATKKTIAAADVAMTATTSATTAAIVVAEMTAITAAAVPAAVATSIATGGANVGTATVAVSTGVVAIAASLAQAHGGLTESKSEQTILISKGERIVQPKQNQDLTKFLNQQSDNGGSRPANVNITIQAIDTQSGVDFIKRNRAEISNTVGRMVQARGGR